MTERGYATWYVKPDDPLRDHPRQYALLTLNGGMLHGAVYGTEQAGDGAIRAAVRREPGNLSSSELHMLEHSAYPLRVERFNRCPTCEQWHPCDVRTSAEAAS